MFWTRDNLPATRDTRWLDYLDGSLRTGSQRGREKYPASEASRLVWNKEFASRLPLSACPTRPRSQKPHSASSH